MSQATSSNNTIIRSSGSGSSSGGSSSKSNTNYKPRIIRNGDSIYIPSIPSVEQKCVWPFYGCTITNLTSWNTAFQTKWCRRFTTWICHIGGTKKALFDLLVCSADRVLLSGDLLICRQTWGLNLFSFRVKSSKLQSLSE